MPEMKMTFPKWRVNGNENLVKLCSGFKECPEAIDLLTQMMQLEPSRRISVKTAMAHPFFAQYNQSQPSPLLSDGYSGTSQSDEDDEMSERHAGIDLR